MTLPSKVLVLGCGYTGAAVARLARARGLRVVATVRHEEKAARLGSSGIEVVTAAALSPELVASLISPDTHVVVAFPPDGVTDALVAPAAARAAAITYVSSTGVYGDVRGVIDDASPLPAEQSERGARILSAEESWRAAGATVLRSPAIYGPDRGMHVRIVRGEHRLVGDGTTYTSRIHVDDLAQLLLASSRVRKETFVVGDRAPATQNEVAEWISREYGVPMPKRIPREEAHETLRADRRVDGSRALQMLGVTLVYPRYMDGMAKPGA